MKLTFTPKVKAKKRTAKQFFDWYKREMKEMKLEEKKEKMRRDFSFAKDAKNFSSYGLKKEEVKEILASLKALSSWNGWSFDDMGILKELPYEKIKEYDKLVDSWLMANYWELKGGVNKTFSKEYRSYHSLEEAIEIAKKNRIDVVDLKQRLQSSIEKRKGKQETREERIEDFLLKKGVIGLVYRDWETLL